MEPEHSNDIVDKNVAIAAPDEGEEDKTNGKNETVQIEIPSPDTENSTAVDQVTFHIPEETAVATEPIAEETSTVSEAKLTPADDSITAVSVTEDTLATDSTGRVVEDSNGNKEVDIEQVPTEQQQQQQQQQDVLQAEDTTKVAEDSEPIEDNTTPYTEVTGIKPTNRPARSPSPTRSSLSRKESRGKHNKRVSFTGPQETLVKFVSETKREAWPLSADFTAELGEEAVGEHVRDKWSLSESWLHCVDYMGEQPPGSNRHQYRVKFSQPTRRRPIPAHTASVYFTLVPGGAGGQVGVWWVMEGQRTLHKPGEGPFREKWLKDILEAKSIICSETLF